MSNNVPYLNPYYYNYYPDFSNYQNYDGYHQNYSAYPNYQQGRVNYYIPNSNNYQNDVTYNKRFKRNFNNKYKFNSRPVECEVCNLFFKTQGKLEEHVADTHIKCSFEDCSFSGPLQILEIHRLKHIKGENGENLIDSKEETIKWINSRIMNFPRASKNPTLSNSPKEPNDDSDNKECEQRKRKLKDSDNGVENGEPNKEERSLLEIYLRNNMNGKNKEQKGHESLICPILNKIYKQPSALIRYTNPYKYEQMLKKLDSVNSPYTFKSSIIEKNSNSKNAKKGEGNNRKTTYYSVPKRPPAIFELIRSDVEKLDGLVVDLIKTIDDMGVTNLLQYLKSNEKCVNIKKYSGSVAAVDAMCWIHRGLISSAVANVRGEMCDKFLKFIISMIALLLSFSITPIMVFDGYVMPAKKAENEMRRERRENAKKEALEMIKKNKNKINTEIMKKCMQAIHVTPEIVYRVIAICKKIGVPVIVSPYEADAEISYLCRSGLADFAISEDSDLIVYGCPKILYKLGRDGKAMELNVPFLTNAKTPFDMVNNVNGELTDREQLEKEAKKVQEGLEKKVKDGLFKDLNHKMFVIMCVLSGTDYDNGYHISGMGLKVAYKMVLEHENLEGILTFMYNSSKWADKLPELKYEELLTHYKNVYNIFLHNIVFNPKNNQLVHINPLYALAKPETMEENPEKWPTGEVLNGYNYLFEMSVNLVNKNVNFMKVARGLVSVVDDMEINYILTESDLSIVDALPTNISSFQKLNKTTKKDLQTENKKTNKEKFNLYNANNQNKDTKFVLITNFCEESDFERLNQASEEVNKDNNKKEDDKNKDKKVKKEVKTKEKQKVQEKGNEQVLEKAEEKESPRAQKEEVKDKGNEKEKVKSEQKETKSVKVETVKQDKNLEVKKVEVVKVKSKAHVQGPERKRKMMNLLNNTESISNYIIIKVTIIISIIVVFRAGIVPRGIRHPYTHPSWDHAENEDKHLISQVASWNPLELNNTDLDISKNHISNVSNNTLNLSHTRLYSLSISYISYFYYVFPLHLNTFNRLFSDVISPKLSILISSVNQFTCLTCDIKTLVSNLKDVSRYLNYNPAQSLLNIIKEFKAQTYVEGVRDNINVMITELESKINYQEIINNVIATQSRIVSSFNGRLKNLYENFKNSIDTHKSSLKTQIQEYIGKIKQELDKHSSCVENLIKSISTAINNLKTNQGNLSKFDKYKKYEKLMKPCTKFENGEKEKLKEIFETHGKYKELLNESCFSEIKSNLEELKGKLEEIKDCSTELTNKLSDLSSDITNTTNIDAVEKLLKEYKEKVNNLNGNSECLQNLQQIGGYITTMKNTLEQEDNKTRTKLKDKVVPEAASYINELAQININANQVENDIKEIKETNDSIIKKLEIAKSSIEFYNSLKKQLDELENLNQNGVNFDSKDFTDFDNNSKLIKDKLGSFQSTIESSLTKTNRAIQQYQEAIKKLEQSCQKNQEQSISEDDESISCELGKLQKYYKEEIPKITSFIEESSEEIDIIKYILFQLENNKTQSPKISGIQSEVSRISGLSDAKAKLPQIKEELDKFLKLQNDTKSLLDTFSRHTKLSTLSQYSDKLQDSITKTSELICLINYYIGYLNIVEYIDFIISWIKSCYKFKIQRIKQIFENFNRYIIEITSKLESIKCYLCELKFFSCYTSYTTTQGSGNYDLYTLKDYMNNLKFYFTKIKTDFTTIKVFFEKIKKESSYIDQNECYLEYLKCVIDSYIKSRIKQNTEKTVIEHLIIIIKHKIAAILKVKSLIINCSNMTKISKIDSRLKGVEQSINKLEFAIEAVVRNTILCSLKSLSNYPTNSCITRGGVINENDPVILNYSLLNVTNYKTVINRLYEIWSFSDEATKLVKFISFCPCGVYFMTKNPDARPSNFPYPLYSIRTTDLNPVSELAKNTMADNVGNHLCLCLVIKYHLRPAMLKCILYLRNEDLGSLSTLSRKHDQYNQIVRINSDLWKIYCLTLSIIYRIVYWIKHKYNFVWVGYYRQPEIKCFCTIKNTFEYHYLISIILYLSSLIENIWRMDKNSTKMAIESLSSLLSEFDMIGYENTKSNKTNNLQLLDKIVINSYYFTNSPILLRIDIKISETLLIFKFFFGSITSLLSIIVPMSLFTLFYSNISNLAFYIIGNPVMITKSLSAFLKTVLMSLSFKYLKCSKPVKQCTCNNDECKIRFCGKLLYSNLAIIMKMIKYVLKSVIKHFIVDGIKSINQEKAQFVRNAFINGNIAALKILKSNYSTHFYTYTHHKNIANRFPSLKMDYNYPNV